MEIEIKKYVEEYWINDYVEGYVKEIKSREEYIESLNYNDYLVMLRFFDREVITLNNKKYYSEPINYTDFIEVKYGQDYLGYSHDKLLTIKTDIYDENYKKHVAVNEIKSLADYKKELFGPAMQLKK